jgi:hypothetical protein
MLVRKSDSELWGGFYIQSSGRWRSQVKDPARFAQLKGYTEFVFYAKGKAGASVMVGFGESGEETLTDKIILTNEWRKYSYDISDANVNSLNGIFKVTLNESCEVQFDEIYFENKILQEELTESELFPQIPIKVEIKKLGNQQYKLYRGGEAYHIKGAGYHALLYKAKAAGANSIRTWGHEEASAVLDSAQKHGMTVMLGLWLQHERHGFNYDDEESVKYQIMKFKDVVDRFKNHPALLLWGIGNEVDLFYTNKKVWNSVQAIANYIHQTDPNHPTCTITAGLDTSEISLIQRMCPDVDIFGVNSYADVYNLPSKFRQGGLTRPYLVTEWGPTGNWECLKTSFGIPIEENSGEKAFKYKERYVVMKNDSMLCVGSYVFLWGHKQEATPTWFGLILPDGITESEAVDELQKCWTGKYPVNRSPHLISLRLNGKVSVENISVSPGQICTAIAEILEPENEPLELIWEVLPESTTNKTGGDWEETPEALKGLNIQPKGNAITFTSPSKKGPYRLYFYAKDKNGNGAYGNVVFEVN